LLGRRAVSIGCVRVGVQIVAWQSLCAMLI
jgi:hypothetical protein